jgi:Flp pilus assembly pilin Flp
MNLNDLLSTFHHDEDGVSATEYVVLLVLIGLAGLVTIKLFGFNLSKTFTTDRGKTKPSF